MFPILYLLLAVLYCILAYKSADSSVIYWAIAATYLTIAGLESAMLLGIWKQAKKS